MQNYIAVLDWRYLGRDSRPDLEEPERFPAAIQFEAESDLQAQFMATAYAHEIARVPLMVLDPSVETLMAALGECDRNQVMVDIARISKVGR